MADIRYGLYMILELLLQLCIHPRVRAGLLALLGAKVGANVRVYECRFINLQTGFRHLELGDDVHIGNGCMIDLKGRVTINRGSALSPRVTIISHSDPGSAHASPQANRYPPESNGVVVGQYCWIGACATVLSGASIGNNVVVGAHSLVRGVLEADSVYAGVPARRIQKGTAPDL